MSDIPNLSKRLVEVRKAAGITRKELSERVGIPYPTITKYENGQREPGHPYLILIADMFDVTIDYLVGRTNDPHGYFKVSIQESNHKINVILDNAKRLNDQGLGKLKDYSEDLVSSGRYEKPTLTDKVM